MIGPDDEAVDLRARLAQAQGLGTVLNLAGDKLPAALIRRALLSQTASTREPRGLRLSHAVITGDLDLENVYTTVYLQIADSELRGGTTFRRATFQRGLSLIGTTVGGTFNLQDAHIGPALVTVAAQRPDADGVPIARRAVLDTTPPRFARPRPLPVSARSMCG